MSATPIDWSRLPAPVDDGGARHLEGARLPPVDLPATDGRVVDLSGLPGLTVVYAYPMTSRPDRSLPADWDAIPGARGCTPQSCAFRDHLAELQALGVAHLFGLSTQDTEWQREAVARLHLPFALLSDPRRALVSALGLPTFEVEGMTLCRRLTMVIRDGVIRKVFYPVFPPDQAPGDVMDHLRRNDA